MSKSMPFLGASIFLKGNWPSEGGFPIPSESRPGKGVCTKSGHSSERARGLTVRVGSAACDQKAGTAEPGQGLYGAPHFPSPSPAARPAPNTCL